MTINKKVGLSTKEKPQDRSLSREPTLSYFFKLQDILPILRKERELLILLKKNGFLKEKGKKRLIEKKKNVSVFELHAT
ncbi:MAG: hypothetical protein GF308_02465 [Candidatus Heimdallarchaeota archaeon]|nr:hypothetical protein [Candidatus Heimdallarchaeota archaeon]